MKVNSIIKINDGFSLVFFFLQPKRQPRSATRATGCSWSLAAAPAAALWAASAPRGPARSSTSTSDPARYVGQPVGQPVATRRVFATGRLAFSAAAGRFVFVFFCFFLGNPRFQVEFQFKNRVFFLEIKTRSTR